MGARAALPGVRVRPPARSRRPPCAGMVRESNATVGSPCSTLPSSDLRRAPGSLDRWSTLEYAAHVRDVFRLYRTRLALMVDDGRPAVRQLGPGRDRSWLSATTSRIRRSWRVDLAAARARRSPTRSMRSTATSGSARGRRSDGASFTVDHVRPVPDPRPGPPSLGRRRPTLSAVTRRCRDRRAVRATSPALFGFAGANFDGDLEWRDGRGRARRGGARIAGGDRGARRRRRAAAPAADADGEGAWPTPT